jgi:hypothetical protein
MRRFMWRKTVITNYSNIAGEEIAMQFPTERRELIILRIIDNFFLHAEPKLAAEQIYLKNVFACGHQRS